MLYLSDYWCLLLYSESAFDQSDPANMFAGSSCPFTEGDYYTSFTLGSGEEFCYGDAGSKVTITGNQMIMNTCSGSATYGGSNLLYHR